MRTLAELRSQADQHGVAYDDTFSSKELMDALRDKLGVADPDLNLDPMKAKDLKDQIAWGTDRPFEKVVRLYGDDRHVVEPKLDGARVRVIFGATGNSIPTGRRSDVTFGYIDRGPNFPHVANLVVPELAGTVIDCEVMMPAGTSIELGGNKGSTKGPLNTIMAVLNINPAMGVARQQKYGWAEFHAFDVLSIAGEPAMHLPLEKRRELLERVLVMLQKEWTKDRAATESYPAPGDPVETFPFVSLPQLEVTEENLQALLDAGYEGGMIKDLDGEYRPGKRGTEWLKVKTMSTGDFFIIGSTPGKGRNEGKVGSLKLAYYDAANANAMSAPHTSSLDATCVKYVADCRGFDDATCDMLTDPETGDVKDEFIGRVVEIMGQGRTKNERIRHPHFVRWRDDKSPTDCDRSQLELFTEV